MADIFENMFGEDDKDYEALDEKIELHKLNQALSNFRLPHAKEQKPLTTASTLKEVADYFDEFTKFDNVYEKLAGAPDKGLALETLIDNINNEIFPDETANKPSLLLPYSFNETVLGNYDNTLGGLVGWLLVPTEDYNEEKNEVQETFIVSKTHLQQIAKGVVYGFWMQKLKTELSQINNEPVNEEPEGFIRFKSAAEKYVLLNELGILDFLKDKYKELSNAKLSLLYAYITDTKNSKSFENCISQHGQPKNEHYPFKENNLNKAENILHKIGIKANERKVYVKQ